MKSLPEMFPNASQSTLERNPHLGHGKAKKNDSSAVLDRKRGDVECPTMKCLPGSKAAPTFNPKGRGIMNKTEAEFALMLEAQKRNGEILRYEYEGITLRWAGIRYTPDFAVISQTWWFTEGSIKVPYFRIKLIEVKGPHIHYSQQAIARFKGCRAFWPEFQFEMWQKQKSGWKRIH